MSNVNNIKISEITLDDYDSSLGAVFDRANLDALYSALTGGAGSSIEAVADTVAGKHSTAYGHRKTIYLPEYKTANDLYILNGNKNILVDFGGQTWTVTFLTTDINGHVIATLWLADRLVDTSAAAANAAYSISTTAANGIDGLVLSKFGWGSGGFSGSSWFSNEYSVSQLRAIGLNAGDEDGSESIYATGTSTTETVTETQRQNHILAPFTLSNDALQDTDYANKSLIDYITTPAEVTYTYRLEFPFTNSAHNCSNNLNDALSYDPTGAITGMAGYTLPTSTGANTGDWYNATMYNVSATANNYNDWGSDYVWAPSVTEVGMTNNANIRGLWETSVTGQNSHGNGTIGANANGSNVTYTVNGNDYIWLRTGNDSTATSCMYVSSNGAGRLNSQHASSASTLALRPALHLDLTAAEDACSVPDPQDVAAVYNGSALTIDNVAAENKKWYNSDSITLDYIEGPMINVGTYKVKATLTQSVIDKGLFFAGEPDTSLGESDRVRYFNFTVKKKGLTAPAIPENEQTYKGTAFDFYFNGAYSPTYMDFTWSDGLNYSESEQKFSATKAGTYTVTVSLKDTSNYAWGADGSSDSSPRTLKITIKPKELSITAASSNSSLTWKKREDGTITVKPTVSANESGVEDTVTLYVYFVNNTTGNNYRLPAVSGHVLDVSKITSTGTYTLYAKIIQYGETDYSEDNANYVISTNDGVWEMASTFEITASGIEAEDMNWYYEKTGDHLPSPLLGADGNQVKLEYSPNIYYTVTAEGNANVKTYSYNGDGFVNGYRTVDSNGNPVTNGAREIGTYTTFVAVEITNTTEFAFDSEHILDGNPIYGWLSYDWVISPRELDFADAEWEYTTDGGDTWIAFNQDGVQVDPEFTNLPILIRLSPDYISSLGLNPDTDLIITYQTNSKKDRGDYTATAEIEISNPSYCTPETADGSDFKITFAWSITNKKIQIKNWNGSQTVTLSNGKAFSVPAVITSDGLDHSSALVYTYECVVNGQPRTATSLDALKAILEEANISDSNPLTVNISVAVKSTQQNSFMLAGNTKTICDLGDSKDVITVWLENETSEYGNVQFILHAEDKDGTDYLQYITITLSSVLLSEPVAPVQGSNYSALIEYLTKTGTYSLLFELGGLYATGFLLDPTTLTFEITPRQVYVPTVNREIVFTGENISLINYLDGYDPALMTIDTLDKRDAGTVYTATITLTDVLNYVFVMRPAEDDTAEATKSAVRYTLAGYEKSVEFANDEHTAALLKWQINPYVLDSSLWNLKGSEGAVLNLPAQFAAMVADGTLDLSVGYRYYEDAAGGVIDPVFKPGSTFYTDAFLEGADASNFVFENGTIVSDKVTYSVPKGGLTAVMSNVKDFVTNTWLGLPIWAWLLIGLFLLILLIIIIAVACKRRKSKEEREEAKARKEEERQRKEEERQRKEEERQAQKERLETERELAKAKQEAELEKIRMQAGMAGMGMAGAGMATMAMPQQASPVPQVQQPMAQQAPPADNAAVMKLEMELAEMRAKLAAQQAQPAAQPSVADNSVIMKLEMELAEMRAKLAAAQSIQPMPMQQPMTYQAGSAFMLEERLRAAEERARYAEERMSRVEEERARQAEERALRAAEERARYAEERSRYAEEQLIRGPYTPHMGSVGGNGNGNISLDTLGALAVAALKNLAQKERPVQITPADPPQMIEAGTSQSGNVSTPYPSDAVITTTTTVDTTQKPLRGAKRDVQAGKSEFDDFDGFYENYKE